MSVYERMQRARPRRAITAALALVAVAAVAFSAGACPNCPAGRQARCEVWNDHFGFNLFVVLLPFLLIGAICFCAERSRRP
jgi:hypothetical protein